MSNWTLRPRKKNLDLTIENDLWVVMRQTKAASRHKTNCIPYCLSESEFLFIFVRDVNFFLSVIIVLMSYCVSGAVRLRTHVCISCSKWTTGEVKKKMQAIKNAHYSSSLLAAAYPSLSDTRVFVCTMRYQSPTPSGHAAHKIATGEQMIRKVQLVGMITILGTLLAWCIAISSRLFHTKSPTDCDQDDRLRLDELR